MATYKERQTQAKVIYEQGLEKVRSTPNPEGQKFPAGSRVRIEDDLGRSMSHFPSGTDATVEYTHAHAYGGSDVKLYSLLIDGRGSCAWYHEHQLKAI